MIFRHYCNFSAVWTYTRLTPRILGISFSQSRYISTTIESCRAVSMAYKLYPSAAPSSDQQLSPIIIMHGMMGIKLHWDKLARTISEKTNRNVYAVDVRNHGESPHTEEFDYSLLGEDLIHFVKEHGLGKAILMGHSMGARGCMAAALLQNSLVSSLFILDMSPFQMPGTIRDTAEIPAFAECMIGMTETIPKDLKNIYDARNYVNECMKTFLPDEGKRLFVLTSLVKNKDGYGFCINLPACGRFISDFKMIEKGNRYYGKTVFINGTGTEYTTPADEPPIRRIFPYASFNYMEGVGHNVQVEKPQEFLDLIIPIINTHE